jgi:serine/threonine-protein kinase
MGAVFLARQVSLRRNVALKVLTPRLAKDENYVRRFFREARSAAALHHPNVVTAIDVGTEGHYKYFVMEYVEGPTVAKLLERGGALDERRAISIAIQVANALDHAHQNGFVHRDIKPANIILTGQGVAKLCDLGLAKEVTDAGGDTQEGQTLGTPDYISPEQARGEADIDIRSDVYSLGATLFHMVTGQVPFPGPTPPVVMTKHLTVPAPLASQVQPTVTAGTSTVIRKMMEKNPDDRYQTPAELLEALDAAREGRVVRKMPVLRPTRRGRGRRRRR